MCTPRPHSLCPPSLSAGVVASGRRHNHLMPGAPYNISTNDGSLRPVVLDAAYFYNNESNDAFLFRPSRVLAAQRQVAGAGNGWSATQQPTTRSSWIFCLFCQVVKGLKYLVDLEISRTVCRKQAAVNLTSCDFQPAGQLHQVSASRGHHLPDWTMLKQPLPSCLFRHWSATLTSGWFHGCTRLGTEFWPATEPGPPQRPNPTENSSLKSTVVTKLIYWTVWVQTMPPKWAGGVTTETHCSHSAGNTILKKKKEKGEKSSKQH